MTREPDPKNLPHTACGMSAAPPSTDVFLPGHNLESLKELSRVLADYADPASAVASASSHARVIIEYPNVVGWKSWSNSSEHV